MKLLLLVTAFAFCAVSVKSAAIRTINGTIAHPGQFPFLAFIKAEFLSEDKLSNEAEYCVGTLISSDYVLSSFMSLSYPGGDVTVILGTDDWSASEADRIEFTVPLAEIVIQTPFSAVKDLALIKSPEPITFTDRIAPISLPRWSDVGKDLQNFKALVAGWGPRFGGENTEPEHYVTYTEVNILSEEDCIYETNEIICIERRTMSRFEEGSPLFTYDSTGARQLATTGGWGYIGGNPLRAIDVYIPLALHLEWISEVTNVEIEP